MLAPRTRLHAESRSSESTQPASGAWFWLIGLVTDFSKVFMGCGASHPLGLFSSLFSWMSLLLRICSVYKFPARRIAFPLIQPGFEPININESIRQLYYGQNSLVEVATSVQKSLEVLLHKFLVQLHLLETIYNQNQK